MSGIAGNLVILAVEDLDSSRDYYINTLGFEEYLRTNGVVTPDGHRFLFSQHLIDPDD